MCGRSPAIRIRFPETLSLALHHRSSTRFQGLGVVPARRALSGLGASTREETDMRRMQWLRSTAASAVLAAAAVGVFGCGEAAAQGKQLTLCWAAWDPANALVELGKDFTKQ